MKQKKWKEAAGALAVVAILGAGCAAGVYAYRSGIQFQPSKSSKELQINQVQFSQDDTAKKEGTGQSDDSAWWKDDQADNSQNGYQAQDQANFLFENTSQLPTTVQPSIVLNQGGVTDGNISGATPGGDGNPDQSYDISGDQSTADVVIRGDGSGTGENQNSGTSGDNGNGTGKEDGTGGNGGNPSGGGDNGGNGGTDSGNTGGGNGGNSGGSDTPSARPADTAKDPETIKPRPSISGNYESVTDGSLTGDEENVHVYIGAMLSDTNALYRGLTVDDYRIFCALDTYAVRRNSESVYYWGADSYGKYIRICGLSFDGGKTWLEDWPVTIPDTEDADQMLIKAEYRFSLAREWKEEIVSYVPKETRLFVLGKKLTEENETINEEDILNYWDAYPNIGTTVYLLDSMSRFLPSEGDLEALFPGWEENGQPAPWNYVVEAGRHILEPMDWVPLPEGYTVQKKYVWMDENGIIGNGYRYYVALQALKAADERAIREENGERILTIPEYVQALTLEQDIQADIIEIPDTVLYMEGLDQYLHVQEAYKVSEDNPSYSSQSGVLLNKEQTSILDIPHKVGSLTLPERIESVTIPVDNQLHRVTFEAESLDALPEINYDRLSDCELVVPGELLDDFLVAKGNLLDDSTNCVAASELPEITYTVENGVIVSNSGVLYKALGTKGFTQLLPSSVESIGDHAFADATRITTLVMEAGMEPTFEKGCFAESNVSTIICSTADQMQAVKKQLEASGQEGIRVQMTASTSDGFRYFQYIEDGETHTIVLAAPETVMTFDGTIENGTIPVTAVGDNAFANCERLQWVILKDCVKEIGYRAFYNCGALEGILIDSRDSITIGNESFDGCGVLRVIASNAMYAVMEDDYDPYISLGYEFLNMNISSFYVLEGAEGYGSNSVSISGGSGIASYAFLDLGKEGKMLYALDAAGTPWLAMRSGLTVPDQVELPADTVELWHFAMADTTSPSGSFTVNWEDLSKLTALDVGTFYGSVLSGSVTLGKEGDMDGFYLMDYAFAMCSKLQSVCVNRSFWNLGEYAFQKCSSLERVEFQGFRPLSYMEPGLFNGCASLTEIELRDSTPPDLTVYGTTPFQFNYDWTTEEEEEKLSLIIQKNVECADAFVKSWRYLFAGCAYTSEEAPYNVLWSNIKNSLTDWWTGYEPPKEEVDAAAEEQLLAGENRVRKMIHIATVSEPSDFYPFHESAGMLTLIGAPYQALVVDLDPANLEIPTGWCLDYIGTGAFGRCKQLEDVYVPDSMAGIEPDAFLGAAENSEHLTVHFAGQTPLTLMNATKEAPFSFGVADEKLTLAVPAGCENDYVAAWTYPLAGYEDMYCMFNDVWQELEAAGVDVLSDEGWAQLEAEMKSRLLPVENRLRSLLGMEQITDVNDLISYPTADTQLLQGTQEKQPVENTVPEEAEEEKVPGMAETIPGKEETDANASAAPDTDGAPASDEKSTSDRNPDADGNSTADGNTDTAGNATSDPNAGAGMPTDAETNTPGDKEKITQDAGKEEEKKQDTPVQSKAPAREGETEE